MLFSEKKIINAKAIKKINKQLTLKSRNINFALVIGYFNLFAYKTYTNKKKGKKERKVAVTVAKL